MTFFLPTFFYCYVKCLFIYLICFYFNQFLIIYFNQSLYYLFIYLFISILFFIIYTFLHLFHFFHVFSTDPLALHPSLKPPALLTELLSCMILLSCILRMAVRNPQDLFYRRLPLFLLSLLESEYVYNLCLSYTSKQFK